MREALRNTTTLCKGVADTICAWESVREQTWMTCSANNNATCALRARKR